MSASFIPHLDILPPAQKWLWPELAATPSAFTLYGGTGITLRLAHRTSVDFDFFSWSPFTPMGLMSEIPFLAAGTVVQSSANTLTIAVDRGGPVQRGDRSEPVARPHGISHQDSMKQLPCTDDLLAIAARVIWFEPPERALADPVRFLAYLMTYGTIEDIAVAKRHLGPDAFPRRSSRLRLESSMSAPGPIGM
jgi:hypothetical protein